MGSRRPARIAGSVPRSGDARRRELLDAVIDTVAAAGLGDRSWRDIAAAVGTSDRMLLHHVGSREELLLAVGQEVERRQAVTLIELPADPARAARALRAHLRSIELRPFERLFFECYARAAQGEAPFTRLLPGAVHAWIDAVADRATDTVDTTLIRRGLAVTRGLLLDLVGTGEEDAVDAAYERLLTMVARAA